MSPSEAVAPSAPPPARRPPIARGRAAPAKGAHPEAKVVIHPEARRDLLARADFVVSTSAMGEIAERYDSLIIGTERGLIDRLKERFPEKTIIPLSRAAICGNMKVNTLAKL